MDWSPQVAPIFYALMKKKLDSYLHLLGLRIQGDLGPYTCYRSSQRGMIWYPRAPPMKPPSDAQVDQRDKWRDQIEDWTELTAAQRQNWMNLASRANLHMHGFNLYLWWRGSYDDTSIHTIERQTGVTVI